MGLTERSVCASAASLGDSAEEEEDEEGSEVGRVMEDGNLTEQQLGLQQAEERLYRDYIHRLVKVRAGGVPHDRPEGWARRETCRIIMSGCPSLPPGGACRCRRRCC